MFDYVKPYKGLGTYQISYGIKSEEFNFIKISMYGINPAFLQGIKCRLFIVGENEEGMKECPLYIYDDRYYALISQSNRHTYAKYIYPHSLTFLHLDDYYE